MPAAVRELIERREAPRSTIRVSRFAAVLSASVQGALTLRTAHSVSRYVGGRTVPFSIPFDF